MARVSGMVRILYPKNAARLAEEAVESAAQAGADFSEFDNAQEGAVNGLALIFSGLGGQFGGNKNRWGLLLIIFPWKAPSLLARTA